MKCSDKDIRTTEEFLLSEKPWFYVHANIYTILQKAKQDLDLYPLDVEGLREVTDSLARVLLVESRYREAWEEFVSAWPQYNVEANKWLAFATVNPPEVSLEAFSEIAQRGMFTLSKEARDIERAAADRERMIREIGNGQSTFSVMTAWGSRKVYDSETGEEVQFSGSGGRRRSDGESGWTAMSDDEIHALHARIAQERRLKNLSVAELRREISPHRPKHEPPSTKPVETSDGYQLINPATLKEFTKPELLKFLENRGNASRILVHQDSRTINQRAVARLKEILQSK